MWFEALPPNITLPHTEILQGAIDQILLAISDGVKGAEGLEQNHQHSTIHIDQIVKAI